MQRVLTRDVRAANGITYPAGTPLDKLPPENRESLAAVCWTRLVPTPQAAPEPAPVVQRVDDEPESDPEPETSETAPTVVADEPVAPPAADESPAIATLALSEDIKERLINAGIHTVDQAKAYAAANKGFRTIKGIVRATNEQILAAIGE